LTVQEVLYCNYQLSFLSNDRRKKVLPVDPETTEEELLDDELEEDLDEGDDTRHLPKRQQSSYGRD